MAAGTAVPLWQQSAGGAFESQLFHIAQSKGALWHPAASSALAPGVAVMLWPSAVFGATYSVTVWPNHSG